MTQRLADSDDGQSGPGSNPPACEALAATTTGATTDATTGPAPKSTSDPESNDGAVTQQAPRYTWDDCPSGPEWGG